VFVNHPSNMGQTNACIFGLLGSIDTKQTFSNTSCFGDHIATVVFFPIGTFPHCVTSIQKFTGLNFINISFIAFIVKLGLR